LHHHSQILIKGGFSTLRKGRNNLINKKEEEDGDYLERKIKRRKTEG
jgi:hypothetical protein